MSRSTALFLLAASTLLVACEPPTTGTTMPSGQPGGASTAAPASAGGATTPTTSAPVAAATDLPDIALGKTTFYIYESYMSPPQQPGDEADAPKPVAKAVGLEATTPGLPRDQRKSLGYGRIRFAKDLSKAYVDVEIAGFNPQDIVMFHVHCGPPGVLGPIIVNFGELGDLNKNLASGKMSVELTNKNITFIKDMPGLKPSLPESCPVDIGFPTQAMTISAMEYLARKGVLYFNIHTKTNMYYGEVRGQIHAAKE
jgi:hypothetical protein